MGFQHKLSLLAKAAAAATVLVAAQAQAGVILSAVSGVIDSGGPGFGSLTETINQAGLSAGYTSGVTDFNTYIASNPTHTVVFSGFEWFSNSGTTSATVTYDLGSAMVIDGMALWNEESSGIGLLNLLSSTDGTTFTSVLSGLVPTDNPLAGVSSYPADVFSFGSTSMRYMRMEMSGCPQAIPGSFPACAIGEVAFREGTADIPEPAPLALVAAALLGLGLARRARRA